MSDLKSLVSLIVNVKEEIATLKETLQDKEQLLETLESVNTVRIRMYR